MDKKKNLTNSPSTGAASTVDASSHESAASYLAAVLAGWNLALTGEEIQNMIVLR